MNTTGRRTFRVLANSGRYGHCGRRGMVGGLQGCQFRSRAVGFKILRTHFEVRLHICHGSNRCRRENHVSKCILNIDLTEGAYTSRFVESDRPFI